MIRLLTHDYFSFIRSTLVARPSQVDILAYVINFQFYKKHYRSTQIFNLLLSLHRSGSRVRIILDSSPATSPNHRTNLFTAREILSAGIPLRMQTIPHPQHGKALLFNSSVLVTGSHNLTQSALTNPLELSLATDHPDVIKEFTDYFNHIYTSKISNPWQRKEWPKSQIK